MKTEIGNNPEPESKQHYMTLYHGGFFGIKDGSKTIESRLYDEKRQQVALGDLITFTKLPEQDEKITVHVVGLSRFKSFKDMFESIEPTKFGYDPNVTVEEQVEGMYEYYSKSDEEKYGVLGIHVRLLEKDSNNE